jgi:hypothetical protein
VVKCFSNSPALDLPKVRALALALREEEERRIIFLGSQRIVDVSFSDRGTAGEKTMDASHKGEVLAGISISERDRALVAQHLSVAGATTVSGKGFHKPREPQQVDA